MLSCKLSYAAALLFGVVSLGVSDPSTFAQAPPAGNGQRGSYSSDGAPQEKAPSLVDPAGPTISLVNSEPVFLMAAALNACGYDEGLEDSAPVRKRVRDEINQAL